METILDYLMARNLWEGSVRMAEALPGFFRFGLLLHAVKNNDYFPEVTREDPSHF